MCGAGIMDPVLEGAQLQMFAGLGVVWWLGGIRG